MVRVFALTALPLAAAAVPRISLDLSAAGTLITSARPAQEHPEGFVQPDGAKVMSRQDWSEECAASDATSQGTWRGQVLFCFLCPCALCLCPRIVTAYR